MTKLAAGLSRSITASEIKHYRDHGVVHLPDLLTPDIVAAASAAFETVMAAPSNGINHLDMSGFAESGKELHLILRKALHCGPAIKWTVQNFH